MTDKQLKPLLREAFEATRAGYPPDRVIADPGLNAAFVLECRARGLTDSTEKLNQTLLNLRKAGGLRGLRSLKTVFTDLDNYLFAAEIAVRVLERQQKCSLDAIICNPDLVTEFDRIAAELSPGFTPLQYRWAALHLRKCHQLRPELVAHVSPPESISVIRLCELQLDDVPSLQGIYIFHNRAETLYVGEAINLRNRIGKHVEHSDNKHLARWIWECGIEDVFLEMQVLRHDTATRVRKALESELIASRSPAFNIRP